MRTVLTFPAALLLLSLGTVGIIAAAFLLGARPLAILVVPIDAILGGYFLRTYAQRPGPVPREPPAPAADAEPFEDPVEMADQLDRSPEIPVEEAGSSPPPSGPP